ncbi:MAG: sensor histidine kinase [Crocinitomicaceae bacterium]
MTLHNKLNDRFKQAVLPSILMGVITNVYILILFAFLGIFEAVFSPILGIMCFLGGYAILKLNRISLKLLFVIMGYIVASEVFLNTYFLGWHSGFFYFLFLLPTVFLLNATWKTSAIILYSLTVIIIIGVLRYLFLFSEPEVQVGESTIANIRLLNASVTGTVVLVVIYYFGRKIAAKDEALMVANAELEKRNSEILNQHSHLQILLKEVHHRVKNNLQIISSLMSLQERAIKDKEGAAVLNDSRLRVEAIALIHQKLYKGEKINRVNFNSYLHEFIETKKVLSPHVSYLLKLVELELSLDTSVPLGLILSEVITNSLKHAFTGIEYPKIEVELNLNESKYILIIRDNGIGLPEDFDLNDQKSLGVEIIVALIEQIDATIEINTQEGTSFTITFEDS